MEKSYNPIHKVGMDRGQNFLFATVPNLALGFTQSPRDLPMAGV